MLWGEKMDNKIEIQRIKTDLESNLGNKIKFASKRGRKKKVVRSGVIEGIYPNIFVIKVDPYFEDEEMVEQRVSYRYSDIITRTVELALCED